jgi:hypothetical protein
MNIKKIGLGLALGLSMTLAQAAPGGVTVKPLMNKDIPESPSAYRERARAA